MHKYGIKYINIILENCEVIKIDGSHIGYFMLDDIRKSLQIFGCNAFGKAETAQLFAVQIHNAADIPYKFFDTITNHTCFERLTEHNDITSIEVHENNGTSGEYFVKWVGDDYSNDIQSSVIDECGNLYIVVSPDTNVHEFFDDLINDSKWLWLRDDWGEDNG